MTARVLEPDAAPILRPNASSVPPDNRSGSARSLAPSSRVAASPLTGADLGASGTPSLRRQALDAAAVADALEHQVRQLEEADQARAEWLAHTTVTRDAAERARAELAARGAPLDADADDAVTAGEWLTAHRAEQAEADQHRRISDEHDLAHLTDQRSTDVASVTRPADTAETHVPDIRDAPAKHITDEPSRIPAAYESEAAVRRAQAALAEIEHRRALDEQRAADMRRADQLNQWAADDSRAADVAARTADLSR